MFNVQPSAEDDRDFLKLRLLPRFRPPRWGFHEGNTDIRVPGIDSSDELFDLFGFIAGSGNPGGLVDKCGHVAISFATKIV
jgi:hypothetical protein